MAPLVISKIGGLNTQPNELEVQPGSLAVAENVEINRDGVVEVARGFEDFSTNLPDFTPAQLIVSGGVAYLHLDNGIWYESGGTWYRKRGAFGTSLSDPTGIVYSNGHLYVSTADGVIFDINLGTGARTVLAGRFGSLSRTDGTGDAARFAGAGEMCLLGGSLYVSDLATHCIRKVVVSTGVVTTPYGSTTSTSAHTDANGNSARFNRPRGIATDGTDLYVADEFNSCIRKIVVSTGDVTTPLGVAAPSTTTGFTDGTGNAARFQFPRGLAYSSGSLYIADTSNHSIRKAILSSSVVSTPVGSQPPTVASGHTDATGASVRFNAPTGLAFVGSDLFVSEENNNCIRKLVLGTGTVTTPAGTTGITSGHTDQIGNSARFSNPWGIASDGVDLYVCDYVNDAIRKVYLSTGYVATFDGASGVNASSTGLPLANGIIVGPT